MAHLLYSGKKLSTFTEGIKISVPYMLVSILVFPLAGGCWLTGLCHAYSVGSFYSNSHALKWGDKSDDAEGWTTGSSWLRCSFKRGARKKLEGQWCWAKRDAKRLIIFRLVSSRERLGSQAWADRNSSVWAPADVELVAPPALCVVL